MALLLKPVVVLVLVLVLSMLSSGTGLAAPRARIRIADSIRWVEVVVVDTVERLRVRIYAPTRDGSRLWQSCDFADATGGIYRCGVDFASKSSARRHHGVWRARIIVAGVVVDTVAFKVFRRRTSS